MILSFGAPDACGYGGSSLTASLVRSNRSAACSDSDLRQISFLCCRRRPLNLARQSP
jgi:hypothetical protein